MLHLIFFCFVFVLVLEGVWKIKNMPNKHSLLGVTKILHGHEMLILFIHAKRGSTKSPMELVNSYNECDFLHMP